VLSFTLPSCGPSEPESADDIATNPLPPLPPAPRRPSRPRTRRPRTAAPPPRPLFSA
jgi:hypothetical protein